MSGVANDLSSVRTYNVDFATFRSQVSGVRVLDGDLMLSGEHNVSLSKVNYGGSTRRFFSSIFSGDASKTTSKRQNAEVRRTFQKSAENFVRSHVAADKQGDLLLKIKNLLTSASLIDVPLSRRTVRMIVEAVDVASGVQAAGQVRPAQEGDITIDGVFGKFTLSKPQYKAMFEQTLLRLKNDPQVGPEQLAVYEAQVNGYLKIFERGGNLGNLGVFFMGSMDMESVIKKMTSFFKAGILPHRVNKSSENQVKVLSKDMIGELGNLRSRRMTDGDVTLAGKVDVTRLVEENRTDVQTVEAQEAGDDEIPPEGELSSEPRKLEGGAKLMTDLVFNDNLLEMQEFQFNDGERIIQTLSKNFETFRDLCLDIDACERNVSQGRRNVRDADDRIYELLTGDGNNLPFDLSESTKDFFAAMRLFCGGEDDAARPLANKIVSLIRQINAEVFAGKPTATKITRSSLYLNCEKLFGIAERLDIEKTIVDSLRAAVGKVSEAIVGALTNNAIDGSSDDDIEKMERMNDKLLLGTLPTYFKNADDVSLRRMFASSLRLSRGDGKPTELEHLDYGAFLMGSGPYMLKLLQGFHIREFLNEADDDGLSPEQRQVLDGVNRIKSSMPGLDVDTIYAHLLALTESNDCPFESVVLRKELGAASVGVTYLCDVKVSGGDVNGSTVVLKMLRPGIEEQLAAEENLFKTSAAKLGLTREVELTSQSIRRELDLRAEFEAMKTGVTVYGESPAPQMEYGLGDDVKVKRQFGGQVDSVKPVSVNGSEIVATKNCMVMEVAPGKSVADWFKDLHDEQAGGFGFSELGSFDEVKASLDQKRAALQDLHQAMLEVSAKLVRGLFDPNGGYFHGDLHAGNMMYQPGVGGAPGKITLIDYGKGTKLSPGQTDAIRKLLAVAAVGDGVSPYVLGEALVDVYRQIMRTETGDPAYEIEPQLRDRLLVEFCALAQGGIESGIGLLASFGRAAASVGAPMPMVFFDFFGTCGKLSGEIRQLEHYMDELDRSYVNSNAFKEKQQSLLDEINGSFAGLFPNGANFNSPDVDCSVSGDIVKALGVMTGAFSKVEAPGMYTLLYRHGVTEIDFGDGYSGLSTREIDELLKAGDDMGDVDVYMLNEHNSLDFNVRFAQTEMNGLINGVIELKRRLAEGASMLDGDVQNEIDGLKGSAEAFRKMLANFRPPKLLTPEQQRERLDKLRDNCQKLKDSIDRQLTENETRVDEFLGGLSGYYDDVLVNKTVPKTDDRVKLVNAVITMSTTCGKEFEGVIGENLNLKAMSSPEVVEALKQAKKEGGDKAIEDYVNSLSSPVYDEFWCDLAARLSGEALGLKDKWWRLSRELGDKIERLNNRQDDVDRQLDETRQLMQTPQKIVAVLEKVDSAVRQLDELRRSMKVNRSPVRFGYDGETQNRPERNFHLYGSENAEVERNLYTDFVADGRTGDANTSVALSDGDIDEYRRLYGFIKSEYSPKLLEGLKDPDVPPQGGGANVEAVVLTRQDLADLRAVARMIEGVFSPNADPVVGVMQTQLDQMFVDGIGKEDDQGAISFVTTRLDKLRKHRASQRDDDPQVEKLDDFIETCDRDVIGEGVNVVSGAKNLLSLVESLDVFSEDNPELDEFTVLEVRQINEQVDAENRFRIKEILGRYAKSHLDTRYPADSDAFCKTLVEKIGKEVIVEKLKNLKRSLVELTVEDLPSEYIPETQNEREARLANVKKLAEKIDVDVLARNERLMKLLVRKYLSDEGNQEDVTGLVAARLAANPDV